MTPITTLALFAFGTEAVIGFILGTSTGLSEVHKSVLVGFAVIYPLLTMAMVWAITARTVSYDYDVIEDQQQA